MAHWQTRSGTFEKFRPKFFLSRCNTPHKASPRLGTSSFRFQELLYRIDDGIITFQEMKELEAVSTSLATPKVRFQKPAQPWMPPGSYKLP